jgi:PTS system fructose-specific IIA component/PTS system nitrogen regulatory IIA component
MKLRDFFCTQAIIPELEARDRNGVIREMVRSLADQAAIDAKHVESISRALIQRENQGSTGFGKGVAVPHVKHQHVPNMIASIGRSGHGVDFSALDRAPVYTVVMLLSPQDDPDAHLAAMGKIFSHLQDDKFRRFLRQADTRAKIEDLIVEADAEDAEAE